MGDATKRENLTVQREDFMARVEGIIDPAYRLATVILLDHAGAEEAVHGATLSAWRRYRSARGRVNSFRTWFLTIVATHCRRRRRWRRLTLRRSPGRGSGDPRDIVGDLPLAIRTALFCRVSLGLPDDEVARVLHTSPVRVRGRVFRARQRVQAELRRRGEGQSE